MKQRIGCKAIFVPGALPHTEEAVRRNDSDNHIQRRRMTMSQTLITSRDPKGLHAVGLFEAIYNKSQLDDARAQRLNERGGELQNGIAKLISELSVPNRYVNEEVGSGCMYPGGYKVKGVAEQSKTLKSLFPELKDATFDEGMATRQLPPNAEGWFAIPGWGKTDLSCGEAGAKT